MQDLKRSFGMSIATLIIILGVTIFYRNSENDSVKIINVDKNTEIRIVEGVKYRCTIMDNK